MTEKVTPPTIAARLFDGGYAESELESALEEAGAKFERMGWDFYDCSLELYGVPPDYRLSTEVQRLVHAAGFVKVYINHEDQWETHYGFDPRGEFKEAKGWRVSYPHKRTAKGDGKIWVEEVCPTWPADWFADGKVVVKSRETTG